MLYREMGRTGDKVSILGYGCMRFPKKNGRTDEERTEKQIVSAIEQGVNYFDTAYIYPGSEATLGRILAKNGFRQKVMIATKMPVFLIHNARDMANTFHTSLERLQTDHVDYYLMHNVTSIQGWQRLCGLGMEDFLANLKQSGKVGRIGFSFHGEKGQFREIVDAYPWDFCQIQYNYLDENFQAGKEGLQYAAGKGLGVIVMEPLRGGLLSGKIPESVQAVWARAGQKRTPAEWALRWVWSHPEVTVLLSGMNVEEHIQENIRIASDAAPFGLTREELALVGEARDMYRSRTKVGCTGCGYCMPCPAGVNIPACFSYYNDRHLFDDKSFRFKYAGSLIGIDGSAPSFASLCRHCGKCETHCPQGLPIQKHLQEAAKDMEGFYIKTLAGMVRGYYRLRGGSKKRKAAQKQ
jgi:uncharacterized protein